MGLTQKLGTIPLAISTDASNNVGIGGSPSGSYKLEVTGTANVSGLLTTSSNITMGGNTLISTGATGFTLKTTTTGAWAALYGDTGGLYLGTNAGNWMFINNSGNVGIGTSSPQCKLQVSGAANFSAVLKVSDTGTESTGVIVLGDGGTTTQNVGIWRAAANSMSSYGNSLNLGSYADMVFATGAAALGSQTERMRISSGGVVEVGGWGTGTDQSLKIKGNAGAQVGFFNHNGQLYLPFLDSGTGTALVLTSGGYINKLTSSIRYKKDVQPIDIGLDFILSLNPVSYNLKNGDTPQVGFIAEDFPDDRLVSMSMIDREDESKCYQRESVNYAQIVAPLVKAIQEQQAQIQNLQEQNQDLKSRLDKAGL